MSRKKHVEHHYVQEHVAPPTGSQSIAKSLGTRGGNIVEVQCEDRSTTLCMIPAKFNKKLWIRKGGLVIVDVPVEDAAGAKVTGNIIAVLYKENLKHFRKVGVRVPDFGSEEQNADDSAAHDVPPSAEGDSGSDSDSGLPPLQANTNHQQGVRTYECSDSESE
jgi:translation initiation factor IF-1